MSLRAVSSGERDLQDARKQFCPHRSLKTLSQQTLCYLERTLDREVATTNTVIPNTGEGGGVIKNLSYSYESFSRSHEKGQ